jgi:hypothetical protein
MCVCVCTRACVYVIPFSPRLVHDFHAYVCDVSALAAAAHPILHR